jgi:hypothetical protein
VAQQSKRGERRCFPVRSVSGRAKWLRSLRPCRLRHACQDKAPGDPCIECACDTVSWWGDLAKVASQRSLSELGFGRVEGAPVAEKALGRGVNSPGTIVPARGWARARRDRVPWADEALTWIVPISLCSLRWWWLPAEFRSVADIPNYGTRQIAIRLLCLSYAFLLQLIASRLKSDERLVFCWCCQPWKVFNLPDEKKLHDPSLVQFGSIQAVGFLHHRRFG